MDKKLAIFGFGNQAKAWALNLRDSGYQISILLRPESNNIAKAQQLNFETVSNPNQFNKFPVVALLTPDQSHFDLLKKHTPHFADGTKFIYAHGFSYTENQFNIKFPQFSHLLLAPKTIASELRFHYQTKDAIAGVMSVEGSLAPAADEKYLKTLAKDLGFSIPPFVVKFSEETTADLFSEQALLCGLYPFVINEAFNQLVQSGHPAELSFLECWHESKLIMNAMITNGPEKFFSMISPNALIGAGKAQQILIDEEFKKKLSCLLEEIQNKTFSTYIQDHDFEKEKKQLLHYWKEQKLTKTYNEMKNLYEKKI